MKKRILFAGVTGTSIALALAAKSRNDLVGRRDRARAAYAQLHRALANRRKWIPPLLRSVKGAFSDSDYERQSDILAALIKSNPYVGAEAELARALPRFFEVAGHYDVALAANWTYLELKERLEAETAYIEWAREQYQDCAREYNEARNQMPNSLLARLTGLLPEEGSDIGLD
jgi:hypothetical protein